ncbi:NUDIX domain-containing protein [Arachidicoccus terrestris]|uniref:NUDIX domain-containing protein n=1 Tax=Arachidicoccus terrestris TaxID=2875539 RepID=UPI001CC603E5|nr:NUDIX hydrolase [Arachidicoccus terrestris]UAY54750.1 NUDIX hydrolase [Arachidicoccus terrestris]
MEDLPIEENPWKVVSGKEVYDNPWINVTAYEVINPSGGNGIYGKVHFKNRAIGVVAMDENNQLFLVGQYRFPLERYSWELPEGGGPLNEAALSAAKRELLEETGLVANNWQEFLTMDLSNSVTDEQATVFLATGLSQKEAAPEPTEKLQIIRKSFSQVFDLVMAGKITDSITVAAILKLKAMGYS